MEGLLIGTVKENFDKDHPGMVQVTFPSFDAKGDTTAWMPVTACYAGKGYGAYLMPEKENQVVVGFVGGDPHGGIVLGSLWNTKNILPPDTADEKNEVRAMVTKGGHRIAVRDGDNGGIVVKTKEGHTVEINDKDKKLTLSTKNGKNKIILDEGGSSVSIDADDKLVLKAKSIEIAGKLTVKGQSVSVEADNDLNLKGKQVKVEGSTLKLAGQSSELTGANIKVESKGILTLKGSMTKIN